MTVSTLWNQGSVTMSGSQSSAPFTLGNQFSVSQSCTLTGIWFYSPSGATTLPSKTVIWTIAGTAQVAGTLNSAATWSGAAGSGWVKCAYGNGVTLSPGINYVTSVFNASGSNWYPVSNGYWTSGLGSAGITSGILSAPSSAAAVNGQSVYNSGGSLAFPGSTVTGYNFWVDVEVTTTAAAVVAPYQLIGPAPFGPGGFQWRAIPARAPVLADDTDAGTGSDSSAITVSSTDSGSGADQGGFPAPSYPLIPPGLASPMAWQYQSGPTRAPLLVPAQDTGTGAESAQVTVSDTDTGTGSESTTAGVSSADTGSGADAGGFAAVSYPLIPPGFSSPMAWQRQAWPAPAPLLIPAQEAGGASDSAQPTILGADSGAAADSATIGIADTDTGSAADPASIGISDGDTGTGADSGSVTATAPGSDAGSGAEGAELEVSDSDTGSGTDAANVGIADQDTGAGADSSSVTATVPGPDTGAGADSGSVIVAASAPSAVLTPPGPFSPMAWQRHAGPAQAPVLVPSPEGGSGTDSGTVSPQDTDTGAGSDTASVSIADTDAGTGTELASVTAAGADSGSGTDSAYAAPVPIGFPLIPPGRFTPMAWQQQAWPSQAPVLVPGPDTGTGADTGSATVTAADTSAAADSATVGVQDSDAGTAADSASVTADLGDADSGPAADTGSVTPLGAPSVPPAAVLVPPGPFSPMSWQRQTRPALSPVFVPGADAGTGSESGSIAVLGADAGAGADAATLQLADADAGTAADSSAVQVPSLDAGTGAGAALVAVADTDAGSAADAASVAATASDADTGSGADAGSVEGTVLVVMPPAIILVPPGRLSPMAWQRHSWPTLAPLLMPGSDAGSAADSGAVTVIAADAGAGSDAASVTATVQAADSGSGADTSSIAATMAGSDAGTSADSGTVQAVTLPQAAQLGGTAASGSDFDGSAVGGSNLAGSAASGSNLGGSVQ